jgi:hypothetical protein
MANSIYWGQGANQNLIGWGQGAANNAIGWGASHYVSWSGETDIIGIGGVLTATFITRVFADEGNFEAPSCLESTLTNLQQI